MFDICSPESEQVVDGSGFAVFPGLAVPKQHASPHPECEKMLRVIPVDRVERVVIPGIERLPVLAVKVDHHAADAHRVNIFFMRGPDAHQGIGVFGAHGGPVFPVIMLGNAVFPDHVNAVFPERTNVQQIRFFACKHNARSPFLWRRACVSHPDGAEAIYCNRNRGRLN